MDNRFNQQADMFVLVPGVSAGIIAITVTLNNNKLEDLVARFTNEKETISRKNWKQGLKRKHYKEQSQASLLVNFVAPALPNSLLLGVLENAFVFPTTSSGESHQAKAPPSR